MSDTLQIFGKTYEGVTGLVAKDSGGVDVVYTVGASASLQANKNVASSSSTFIVTADSGYDGLSQVTVTGMAQMSYPNLDYSISSTGTLNMYAMIYEGYSPGYAITYSDQLSVASGTIITPSSTSQIAVTSGKYTTGNIVVAAAPSANLQDNKTITPTAATQIVLPDVIGYEDGELYLSITRQSDNAQQWNSYDYMFIATDSAPALNTKYHVTGTFTLNTGSTITINTYKTCAYDSWVGTECVSIYPEDVTTTGSDVFTILYWYGDDYDSFFVLVYEHNANITKATPSNFKVYTTTEIRYDGLKQVTVEASMGVDITPFITRTIASYDAPAGLTAIGAYAFASCLSLASVTLPSSVTTIYPSAFHNCRALTSIDISNVTQLQESAFSSCYNLSTVALPNRMISFSHYTFKDCYNLNLSSLPTNLWFINPYTFSRCSNLSLTSLPSTLEYVGNRSFEYCKGLTSLSCSGSLELNSYTFNGDTNLTTVNFPNTVQLAQYVFYQCSSLQFADVGLVSSLEYSTFYNCNALSSLILRKTGSICTLQDLGAFTNTPMRGYNSQTGTVYVPSSLISTYQTATNWSTLYTNGTVSFVAIEGSPYEL